MGSGAGPTLDYGLRPYFPLVRNPHVLTIAASLWPRTLDERRFPVEAKLYRPEPEVRVLVHTQKPVGGLREEVVLVHGLEGSSESVYMRGMAQALLEAGCAVHRFNLRTCGGSEFLCTTLYHAGLTTDLFAWLMDLDRRRRTPVYLVGFSLGANIALKLAGEMGEDARRILKGVCAISTPLDLAACARRIGEPRNRLYERHFLRRMRRRLNLRRKVLSNALCVDAAERARSLWEFDDRVTAPAFGFQGAEHYYSTQSCGRFLEDIRVPALLIQAKDDPMIPFGSFHLSAIGRNGCLQLAAVEHGGHIGFLSRTEPRFWHEAVVRDWIVGGASAGV
jgi:predicted alpha/beta-fold hydrolase